MTTGVHIFNLKPSLKNTTLFQIKAGFTITEDLQRKIEGLNITEKWCGTILGPVINQMYPVSIRMMDWLMTNYSKKYKHTGPTGGDGVWWIHERPNGDRRTFILHDEYNAELTHKTRRLFDPFRRGDRVMIEITMTGSKPMLYSTTLGQLTFWKWADIHGVVQYACDHATEIDNDMNEAHYARDLEKSVDGKRKRSSLSKNINELCCSVVDGRMQKLVMVFDSSSSSESEEEEEEENGKACDAENELE
tara:strand:- start:1949 stop:2692 length:744 start_codon:yes stop_codon:yes gene_type:complete